MKFYEKTLSKKLIYSGNYLKISNIKVELPNGKVTTRDIINHPGACAIIPFIDNDTILLIEQFRKPLNKTILEIPAGKLNTNECILDCAHRELEEETGYKAKEMTYLGSIATVPGFCDEIIHLFKATNLSMGSKCCDEDEFTEVKFLNLNDVKSMVKSGQIIDAKTISILAYL